jgi:hypothetical protein
MNSSELEAKYLPCVRRVSGVLLMPAAEAIRLLEDSQSANVKLIGVEAFRLLEGGGIQPAMEFSNISYGAIEEEGGKIEFNPDLRLRTPWNSDPEALENTRILIAEGAANGYSWYEVSLEDLESNELLFFRRDA